MKNSKGFTLIELLIVIGVLGILAAGLLAAVDPFEQLKKGRDTNRRNIAVEFHNAMIRYYATHGRLPIDDGEANPPCTDYVVSEANATLEDFNGGDATTLVADSCMDQLIQDGELKADYVSGVGAGDMTKFYIYSATGVDLTVCYEPESKSFYNDAATKWTPAGGGAGFIDASGVGEACETSADKADSIGEGVCFWCAK